MRSPTRGAIVRFPAASRENPSHWFLAVTMSRMSPVRTAAISSCLYPAGMSLMRECSTNSTSRIADSVSSTLTYPRSPGNGVSLISSLARYPAFVSAPSSAAKFPAAADTLATAQEKASTRLAQAQEGIAKQLDRIAGLASTIDQTLQLQKSVDGTLKGVTAAEEFKSTLLELKRHLADSDQLLKNAARPRTLRLVENPAED